MWFVNEAKCKTKRCLYTRYSRYFLYFKDPFARSVSVAITVKFCHYANCDRPFDGQNVSVNLTVTETETETVRVNGPYGSRLDQNEKCTTNLRKWRMVGGNGNNCFPITRTVNGIDRYYLW